MDLSLIIPTKDRPKFIEKILNYYSSKKFKDQIIFADSSNYKNYIKNKKTIKKYKNIKILHSQTIGWTFESLVLIKKKINTTFCLFSGDDDFYHVENLKFLTDKFKYLKKKNNNIFGIAGKGYRVEFTKNDTYVSEYLTTSLTSNNIFVRLKSFKKQYTVCMYSIVDTDKFKKILDIMPAKQNRILCPDKQINGEILPCLLMVCSGKMLRVNKPYLIQTVGHSRQKHPEINIWKNSKNFKVSKQFAKKILKKHFDVEYYLDDFFSNFKQTNFLSLIKKYLIRRISTTVSSFKILMFLKKKIKYFIFDKKKFDHRFIKTVKSFAID